MPRTQGSPLSHDILFTGYIQQIESYIRDSRTDSDLTRLSDLLAAEERIVNIMIDIGFFRDIIPLGETRQTQVNPSYDPQSLVHRFIIRYISLTHDVLDIDTLINQRLLLEAYPSIPTTRFSMEDLYFLDFLTPAGGTTPRTSPLDMPARRRESLHATQLQSPEMFDFIINNQKLKLAIHIDAVSVSQPTCAITIILFATSERRTMTRYIASFENPAGGLVFRRMSLQRPAYGFKFVRRDGGLIVKELH